MDFKQVCAKAESGYGERSNKDTVRIAVASLSGDAVAGEVLERFKAEVNTRKIKADVVSTGSFGCYSFEPVVLIEKPGKSSIMYGNVTADMVPGMVDENNPSADISKLPLLNLQRRVALRNCGYIDPANINDYIVHVKGYSGLSKALQMDREKVIAELKESGLRGKGGGGFYTAEKWQICHDIESEKKYVVCNAIDADPLAVTTRLLLESDPHSVLEGMVIAAYAVGASHCIVYLNEGYKAAQQRLANALAQMKEYTLTGSAVLDSAFNVEIEVREVPVSLVSGEETALLNSLEGKQVMPYIRPPYPAVNGLDGVPTLINNVETLACVAAIFQNGPDWYSECGTEQSKGTKVLTLAGSLVNKCTVEVPFGTTVKSLVTDIGGGIPDGKTLKAVQFGGPAGAFFSADSLDIPIDYEVVKDAGSIIGSGTVEVFDTGSCAVGMAYEKITYLHSQSCGKCVFCREGTYQMSDMLGDITDSKGKNEYLDLITELAQAMKIGCICGLGRNAWNPVMSSIVLFRDEYDAHINEKRCPVKGDM